MYLLNTTTNDERIDTIIHAICNYYIFVLRYCSYRKKRLSSDYLCNNNRCYVLYFIR